LGIRKRKGNGVTTETFQKKKRKNNLKKSSKRETGKDPKSEQRGGTGRQGGGQGRPNRKEGNWDVARRKFVPRV